MREMGWLWRWSEAGRQGHVPVSVRRGLVSTASLQPTTAHNSRMPRDPVKRKESKQRYNQSDKGKANQKAYNQTDQGKARKQAYDQSDQGQAAQQRAKQRAASAAAERVQGCVAQQGAHRVGAGEGAAVKVSLKRGLVCTCRLHLPSAPAPATVRVRL
jgi:hypothetical protein